MRYLAGYCLTAIVSIALVALLAYTLWPVVDFIGSLGGVIGSALAGTK